LNLIPILVHTLAQATQPAATGGAPANEGGPPPWLNLVPFIFLIALLLFFSMRTKKGEQHKREDMLSKLKKGDEVQTIGGLFGRVMEVKDDRIILKIDESTNTKVQCTRSAIHRVVGEEKVEKK
jgi:preprotein translocase subunit YajC